MGSTFSPDQQSVIDARQQNILVSAAAGSGKTSVLTERIVGLVNDKDKPVDIDRILVVTFTNAAAREMKERIGQRLNALISENPGNAHLEKQATLIHGAQITTIDSFCLYLVKNHFHKIGLDPAFRIANEGEMKLLKQEILKEVIKAAYEEGDENFYHVVDCYSKRDNDDSLEDSILRLFTYSMSHPWPEKWLEENRENYAFESLASFENSKLIQSIKSDVIWQIDEKVKTLKKLLDISLGAEGPYVYEETIKSDLDLLKGFKEKISNATFDEIKAYKDSFEFANLSRKKCECDPILKERVAKQRNKCKDALRKLFNDYFGQNLTEAYENMRLAGITVNKLIDLTEEFMRSFDAEKRKRGIIDFSDMEHMAISILIQDYKSPYEYTLTDVAKGYRDYFEEVMVDEYQDSNLVQELIVQSVSTELGDDVNNRFMVGDVKQSIYRFRMARPEIFMGKVGSYKKGETEPDRLITLKQNFRSRKAVIDTVNGVFEDIMTLEQGGVSYDDDARLYPGASFNEDTNDNVTELLLLKNDGSSADGRDLESEAIAAKIKSIVGNIDLFDVKKQEKRKASYKDIAILFRSPTKWRDSLKHAFEKNGIPYRLEGVGSFYGSTEISEVMSVLRVINNPLDDISLYAAMTSRFGKMTDEECARIKSLSSMENRFLWEKVKSYAIEHEDNEKVNNFVLLIKKYRDLSKVLSIQEMISALFDETGYKYIVAALPNGEQRLANIELLLVKAGEYAKTSFYGLFHFIQYVELIKKIEEDEGEANIFDENADVVRIMSIHASKGLEFPITFIGGVDESFNTKDSSAEFVMDMDAGIGASSINANRRTKMPTLLKKHISAKIKRDNIGEEIRILYVAMTRAKEKLILTGIVKEPQLWLDGQADTSDNSYLGLMADSLLKMKDKVVHIEEVSVADIAASEIESSIGLKAKRKEFNEGALKADGEVVERIKERISFEYPHENLSKLYTKTTVSELKMAAIELEHEESESVHPFEENEPKETIPLFAGGDVEVKGTDRGTAYHNVLQLLDFKRFAFEGDKKSILEDEIKKIVAAEAMTEDDVKKVDKEKLLTFLDSDVAKEMSIAASKEKLYKEQPFVIGVPASTVDESFPDEETLLVQGVIDVYFVHDDKITVLDYKTDRISSGEELVRRYKKQLDYYGEAIKQLTGLEVEKKVLYSFGLGDTFLVD